MDKKRLASGFTLIELLVVIAIIGILASIVLVSLNGARAKARDAQRVSTLVQLQRALELYVNSSSGYPIMAGGCIPTWQCWAGATITINNPGAGAGPLLPSSYIDMTKIRDPSQLDNGGIGLVGGSACARPQLSPVSRLYTYYSNNGQKYYLATALENPPLATDPHYYGASSYSSGTSGCSGFANYWIDNGY